ncbi:MAG: DUF4214 domain-containing protein [Ruminococcus sp.]|nr:DUF4214 domain-containing protein [Ruminococcus sp.]
MKLKKMLAALTSAALAVSTMAFTPLTASADGETRLFEEKASGAKSAVITYDINAVNPQAWSSASVIIDTWDNTEQSSGWIKCGIGGADQAQYYDYFKECTESATDQEMVVDLTNNPDGKFSVLYKSSSEYEITVKKVEAFDSLQGGGNSVFSWENPDLDTTTYAPQNVPLVELTGENKSDMNLPGVFDLSKANGPQARLEITFTTSAAWGGMKLLDATDSANVDYDNPLTMIQGTDVIGQYTKSIKLSDLGSSAKTIWLNTWSVASIDSIVIYNDATKGDIYTIPVVTVAPDTVEVTAAKTAELVGTPVSLEAAVSNANGGEINVDYNVEWTVDPAEGATVTGDKTSATLSATKACEYTVTCTVKAEDGTTYATDSVKVTFTAPINPINVTADATELYTGETTRATATRDGKAVSVTWKSSDEKIATVDEKGVITAVGKGTVTITATPEDGSPASVVIKVKEAGQEQKVEQFVDRLYNTLLGRTPDEHSADHKNDLLADKTACDVARNFVLSEEFLNMGLTNEEVVDKMYMAFLGRPADEAGKADWVNRLNNGCSYAHVFYGFTQCNEFAEICADYGIKVGTYEVESPRDVNCNLTAFVSRLYGKVLGRTYDVPGLDNHTAKYLKTGDIYAMAYDFIFSPEFTKKELTDEEFVELMYNTFFDRGSDPEGKAHWLEVLAGEGTREDVLKGFVGSQECAELVESFKI